MATLFEQISEAILLGYTVNLSSIGLHLQLTVSKYEIKKVSALPLNDHFYEEKVVKCIEWSMTEIAKEIAKKTEEEKPESLGSLLEKLRNSNNAVL